MIPICMSTPRWEPVLARHPCPRALFHPWSRSATRAIRGSSSLRAKGFTTPTGTLRLPHEGGGTSPGAAGRAPAESRSSRSRRATSIASPRERTPSLRRIFLTCDRTVSSERKRRSAIPSVVSPSQRRSRTSHSRGVSGLRTGRRPGAVLAQPADRLHERRGHAPRDDGLAVAGRGQRRRAATPAAATWRGSPPAPARRPTRPTSTSSVEVSMTTFTSAARSTIAARGLEAVQHRHDDVHDDDVGPVVDRELDGLAPVGRLGDDDDPGGLERVAQDPAGQRVVVGDDDPQRVVVLVRLGTRIRPGLHRPQPPMASFCVAPWRVVSLTPDARYGERQGCGDEWTNGRDDRPDGAAGGGGRRTGGGTRTAPRARGWGGRPVPSATPTGCRTTPRHAAARRPSRWGDCARGDGAARRAAGARTSPSAGCARPLQVRATQDARGTGAHGGAAGPAGG